MNNTECLDGKNCFITGANGGLGKEIAKSFANKGCNLFLTAKETDLVNLKTEIESISKNIKVSYETADLRNIDEIKRVIEKARKEFGSIDILVNCAAEFYREPIEKTKLDEFQSCMDLNVRAPFLLCKEFSQDMSENRWGRIVNIASSSAYSGFKDGSIYCTSKHALLGLSRVLHNELKERNVRTFCISPGSMKTEMGKVLTEQDYSTFMDPKEVSEFITYVISFDNELISEEIRLNRMTIR